MKFVQVLVQLTNLQSIVQVFPAHVCVHLEKVLYLPSELASRSTNS
jgi:hypothetical protein